MSFAGLTGVATSSSDHLRTRNDYSEEQQAQSLSAFGIQILPVSEVAAKDEFFNIKGVTRDDLLAAHRVPPQLMGVLPSNTGGFGAVEPAARVFARNELVPLQSQFQALNEWPGEEVIRFVPYELGNGTEDKA